MVQQVRFFYDVFIEHEGLLHVLPLSGGPHDFIVSPIPLVTNLGLKPGWGWARVQSLMRKFESPSQLKTCCLDFLLPSSKTVAAIFYYFILKLRTLTHNNKHLTDGDIISECPSKV